MSTYETLFQKSLSFQISKESNCTRLRWTRIVSDFQWITIVWVRSIKAISQHQLSPFQTKSGMVWPIKQSKSSSGLIFEIERYDGGRGRKRVSVSLSSVRKVTIARYSWDTTERDFNQTPLQILDTSPNNTQFQCGLIAVYSLPSCPPSFRLSRPQCLPYEPRLGSWIPINALAIKSRETT